MSPDLSAFTDSVIASIGSKSSQRVKTALPILIRKLHEFCIEADVTVEEWMETCNLVVQAGQMSSSMRNEIILMTDVLGIESLVDTLSQIRNSKSSEAVATHSAILGPFYRSGVKPQPNDTTIIRQDEKDADYVYLTGTVHDQDGKPLAGAILDVWHDAPDGLYDSQSPDKPEHHCRGRFESDKEGRYSLVCLKPTPYPIPYDGPAGDMLKMMDRHPFRPAHIHYMVQAPGHRTLVTQVFDAKSKYLEDDSVFAVKDSLVVDFVPLGQTKLPENLPDKEKIRYTLNYDIHLATGSDASVSIEAPTGAEVAN